MSDPTGSLGAIFFDIDDTLYSTSEFAKIARRNSVKAMIEAGLNMELENCFQELTEIIDEMGANYEHHYDKLLVRIPKEKYEGTNPALIIAAGVVAYHETKFKSLKPYPDVVELFNILSRTKITLGIITAGLEIKQAEKLIRLKLLDYIDTKAIFITGQLAIGKQNIKLYQHACHSVNLPPGRCMYVGDNPITDVDLPNQLGIITVLNRRSGKYLDVNGKTQPKYIIHNMWELLEILRRDYGLEV
jgi:putative hydrolase of the HAD superfamily